MSKHDPNTEPPHHLLEKLGQGSFGTIYHYPTHPTVFKTIDNDDGDDNLWFEFNMCVCVAVVVAGSTCWATGVRRESPPPG